MLSQTGLLPEVSVRELTSVVDQAVAGAKAKGQPLQAEACYHPVDPLQAEAFYHPVAATADLV